MVFILLSCQSAIACFGCGGYLCIPASFSFEVPDHAKSSITADTLNSLINSGASVLIIEYRQSTQQGDIHIPGALIINDDIEQEELADKLPEDPGLIIVYPGLEGADTEQFVDYLQQMGHRGVIVYSEGLAGWMSYGYMVAGMPE